MLESLKKIIFVSVILLVLVAIVLSILAWYKRSKDINTNQLAESQQEMFVPSLPEGSQRIGLKDIKNKEEIRAAFQRFAKESAIQDKVQEAYFLNDKNQSPALDDFSSAMDLNVPNNLKELLDQERYQIFYCTNEETAKEFGFIVNIRRFSQNEAIDYMTLDRRIKNNLADWEKTMLNDLHGVLFPKVDFNKDQLNQNVSFRNGKYRYAEVTLPDETRSSINYGNFGGPIVFSTSLECMDRATANFFDE